MIKANIAFTIWGIILGATFGLGLAGEAVGPGALADGLGELASELMP